MTSTAAPGEISVAGVIDRSLFRNASILFVGQAVGLIVPLVTIPYLARVLGPDGWGPILACQAFGNWLLLILEFGFDLSGTRDIARARVEPETLGDVVQGIQSAKALLVLTALPLAAIAIAVLPALRHQMVLVVWTVVFAVTRGLAPLWFFQGIERVKGAVTVDAVTRALASLGVFLVVRRPTDGWYVLALQGIFGAVSLVILTFWLSRHVALRTPRYSDAVRTMRATWSIFACRASAGVYIQANALILSTMASASVVAFFGGAERIIRAAVSLLQPITQAFLPRVTYLHASDPPAARQAIRRALVVMFTIGLLMGAVAFVGAPLLVGVILGPRYAVAIDVLRVFAILPPVIAVNTVLGLYWALPWGHERAFLTAIVAAGLANIALAIVLVSRFGAVGMALAAVGAELMILAIMAPLYLRSRA